MLNAQETADNSVVEHLLLVKKIARHLLMRLPAHVCFDDLIQSGMIGLLEASTNYQDNKGASFSTYASIRIRGAMIDEMRRSTWAPRSVLRNSRKVAQAISDLESSLGRDATLSELASHLAVSIEQLDQMRFDSHNTKLLSIDDLGITEEVLGESAYVREKDPQDLFESLQNKANLDIFISKLPERDRLVILLYYDKDWNLKQIGQSLEISESRVSQILTHSIQQLQDKWAQLSA